MRETITMGLEEQRRALVLTKLAAGSIGVGEAAAVLGVHERTVYRLRARLGREGPAALVHGNRGRPSRARIPDAVRERVLELARGELAGANDCHLVELLAERGIVLSRVSVRRLLRQAGIASPRRRRAARHRSRRERMPQAGLLLQLDGSRHDWLGERGPRLTLVGAIDDATGIVTAATFRDQEDAAGYLTVLRDTIRRYGRPVAVYHDRHTIFQSAPAASLEEQLADRRRPTQVGRALHELGIGSIAASSPQAKGRIERVWGTLQDRLVTELRIAGVADRDAANALLGTFLVRFNRRFAVPARQPESAWRPLSGGVRLDAVCCFKYHRVVAADHTIELGPLVLQLPPIGRHGYAGRRVEVQQRLDGRIIVSDGRTELVVRTAPVGPGQLRRLADAAIDLDRHAPSVGSLARDEGHPWRRVNPRSKLGRMKQAEAARFTDQLT